MAASRRVTIGGKVVKATGKYAKEEEKKKREKEKPVAEITKVTQTPATKEPEKKGLFGKATDFLAAAGVSSAKDRQILPSTFSKFEKDIKGRIDPEAVKTDPVAKAIGLVSLATELTASGLATGALATAGITAAEIGTRTGSILHTASVHHWSKSTGMLMAKKGITVSQIPILEKGLKIGTPGITKLFQAGANLAINQKTTALATSALSKYFSGPALAFFGGWAMSVFMGKWGQAESPEPITIPIRDALRIAEETHDYTIFDEAVEAAEEITHLSTWDSIISYSPFSALFGSSKKLKGAIVGIKELKAIGEESKRLWQEELDRIESGEPSEFEKQRISSDEASRERQLEYRKEDEEYYNAIEAQRLEDKAAGRTEDEAYYAQIATENRARKLKEREEDEAYYAQF